MVGTVTPRRAAVRFGAICLVAVPVAVLLMVTAWLGVMFFILGRFDGNALRNTLQDTGLGGVSSALLTAAMVSVVVLGAGLAVAGAAFRRSR
jgi:hypothetical protein